jgi:hypothetical protein
MLRLNRCYRSILAVSALTLTGLPLHAGEAVRQAIAERDAALNRLATETNKNPAIAGQAAARISQAIQAESRPASPTGPLMSAAAASKAAASKKKRGPERKGDPRNPATLKPGQPTGIGAVPAMRGSPPAARPSRPETVLNGSAIPREMEIKKQAPAAPNLAPGEIDIHGR